MDRAGPYAAHVPGRPERAPALYLS
jgi:hypothetical protein